VNTCSWFGRENGSPYAYAICAKCGKASTGAKVEVLKKRTGVDQNSADATGVESTAVSMEHGEFKENKKVLTDKKKRYYSEIVGPGMLLNGPEFARVREEVLGVLAAGAGAMPEGIARARAMHKSHARTRMLDCEQ
jgi:hypothetical protein